jgi:hypothetical protein
MKRFSLFVTMLLAFVALGAAAFAQSPAPAIAASAHMLPSIHITPKVFAQTGSQYPGVPAASSYEVNLTWTAPAGQCAAADTTIPNCGWVVYREASGGTTYTAIATLTSSTATPAAAYSDTSVVAGTTYSYIVETTYAGANSGPSNVATVAVPNPPGAPTSVTAAAGGSN